MYLDSLAVVNLYVVFYYLLIVDFYRYATYFSLALYLACLSTNVVGLGLWIWTGGFVGHVTWHVIVGPRIYSGLRAR